MRPCPKCGKEYPDDADFCVKDGTALDRDELLFDDPFAQEPERKAGATVRPGSIFGRYKVLQEIGKGGMGIVYLAEHVRLGRRVAIKVLRPEFVNDATLVRRFFDEARAANQVGHENIVEIFDFVDQGDHRYYVMELLEGESLAAAMADEGRPISLQRTYRIAMQVADALAAVHDKGIVHRDLKPDNIFLTRRMRSPDFVKLLDFGVAKLMDRSGDGADTQTQAGVMLGTPAYMSPEQLRGEPVDRRADIYAFGVILYQMVTGVRPFRAKSIPELMIKHCSEPPPPLATVGPLPHEVPAALEQLIFSCLEKRPEQRPFDMHEIEVRLEAFVPEGSEATPRPALRHALDFAGTGSSPSSPSLPQLSLAVSMVSVAESPPISLAAAAPRPESSASATPATASGAALETQRALIAAEAASDPAAADIALALPSRRRRALVAAGVVMLVVAAVGIFAATRGGADVATAPPAARLPPASPPAAPDDSLSAPVEPAVTASPVPPPIEKPIAQPSAQPIAPPISKRAVKPNAPAKPRTKPKPTGDLVDPFAN